MVFYLFPVYFFGVPMLVDNYVLMNDVSSAFPVFTDVRLKP